MCALCGSLEDEAGGSWKGRTTLSFSSLFSQTPFWPRMDTSRVLHQPKHGTHGGPGLCPRCGGASPQSRCEAEVPCPSRLSPSPPFRPHQRVPSSTPGFLSIPSILEIPVETPHSCDLDAADAGTATLRAAGVTISGHPSGLSACSTENVHLCSQFDLCMWLIRHSQARLPSKRLPFPVCGV